MKPNKPSKKLTKAEQDALVLKLIANILLAIGMLFIVVALIYVAMAG